MKKSKDLSVNNENILNLAEASNEIKLLKAEKLLEHVEECIYNGTRPDPGKIKQADTLLNEIYHKDPHIFNGERAYLWEMLGWAYHIFGDMRKAEKCLRKQAGLQPGRADAYLNLGCFYDNGGMPGLALSIYMEGLEESPDDPCLLHNLAELSYRSGLYEAAHKYIYQAQNINPDCPYNQELKEKIKDETFLSLHLIYPDNMDDKCTEDSKKEDVPKSSGLQDKLTPESMKKLIEELTEIETKIDISSLCCKNKLPHNNNRLRDYRYKGNDE